jgi:hypothetical protein
VVFLSAAAHADVSLVTAEGLRGAKEVAKEKGQGKSRAVRSAGALVPLATGSVSLIDSSGLKFFIDTNIAFSTSSSASGSASEAKYTHAVSADTLNGGVTASTLYDAYDGYNTLCFNTAGSLAPCSTGPGATQTIYNNLGAAAPDTGCIGAASGVSRQYVFPVQTSGNLRIQRKVFVPDNDTFIRWMNSFQNTGATPVTVSMVIYNNLGSDSNTKVVANSSGALPATVADKWVTTFQNWSGTTSSDVRLGHVLWGPGGSLQPAVVHFVDGSDRVWWGYTFNVPAGATRVVVNLATGQPTRAAAAAKAALLAAGTLDAKASACMSVAEQQATLNFVTPAQGSTGPPVPAASPTSLAVLALGVAAAGFFLLRRFV